VTTAYREKILGCWLGKAVGGTLGQTFEGLSGPLTADFYYPVPDEMVPNDDLDLQVLYACVMHERGATTVERSLIADCWRDHVEFPWNEYGVAMRNLAEGIEPPYTGSFDNWFTCGEGAAIRSELWACLAPGDPDRAAAYAYEDACFDHAGEGVIAAQFLARLQSIAFVESDPDTIIDRALAGIPESSDIHAVVTRTRQWVREGLHWIDVRARIMADFGRSDFTDVRPNTGFVILGWLAGTTFSEQILICNNSGEDCDSSTATLGALLGIIDASRIEERWLAPIGRDLVLNDEITGIEPPATLDEFTDMVIELAGRLDVDAPAPQTVGFDPAQHRIPVRKGWYNTTHGKWDVRDQTELPPVGSALPEGITYEDAELDGTWTRMPRTAFEDRILMLTFSLDGRGRENVRLMFNSTEHHRIWLDGEFLHGAQGSQFMFPAPHMAPVGQYVDFTLSPGSHELTVAVKQPPQERETAEWVIGLVELPSALWVENAFRP